MLPKTKRLDKNLFNIIFNEGKKVFSNNLTLIFKELSTNENSRFSFVVPKKIEKSAVKRIFLKRKGYGVIEDVYNSIKLSFGCIFIFKNKPNKLIYNDFKEEIIALLKKASVVE